MERTSDLVELRAGEGIRWAIGSSDGLRSSTWRFWGNKKGDFYLSVRSLGGTFKTSLHRDRRCQTGFTKEYATRTALERGRHFDRWELPDELLTTAFQVVTPARELSRFRASDKQPMKWLPIAPPGSASIVTVFVATPKYLSEKGEPYPGARKGAELVGLAATRNRSVFLVHSQQLFQENLALDIEQYRRRLADSMAANGTAESESRAVLFCGDGAETRYVVEVAIAPLAAPPAA